MGRPLDVDLRRRAVACVEAGASTREAAERLVSKAAIGAWARLKRRSGDVLPKRQGSGFGSVLDPCTDFLLGLIEANKDITRVEMRDALEARHGPGVVPSTLWYWLDRRAITYKKRLAMPASRIAQMSA